MGDAMSGVYEIYVKDHFAAAHPARTGGEAVHDRKNRSAQALHFQKGTPLFGIPEARGRESWLRV